MRAMGREYVYEQPVSLRDLDGFGHVNNAVYLTYIENARVGFLENAVGRFGSIDEIANVMAEVTLTFRQPLRFGDRVGTAVSCTKVGRKSFELAYTIRRGDGAVAATAQSVQVMFDLARAETMPVPDEWRSALQRGAAAATDETTTAGRGGSD